MLPSCLQTSEHNLGNCSSAHSLLLEPSRAGTRLPELPLPGRGVILCQPHVDKCHSGKVPVDTTGSQGKPALSGSVTTPGHQVSVASREPPIMSLQGPSAKPPHQETPGAVARAPAVLSPHAQALQHASFTWLSAHHATSRMVLIQDPSLTQRTAPFSNAWGLFLFPPGKRKHQTGSSAPRPPSPYQQHQF